ncbi:T9SS type A sorting domain-containing protein [Flammeovirga agarivorans]|uniref:T9SS type A sorting domain-containing protein n=1 Tax=Flammeovirga agarivorans TaxID=2726742 RepID=A0A7X8XXS6_9BACT|nr:T9SS type A sorting domain-containing protein [Flammeovirga agarivorans]NLR93512.1 T9SS type A sorting domain-containing protein [Flammeovirga agarivorans]
MKRIFTTLGHFLPKIMLPVFLCIIFDTYAQEPYIHLSAYDPSNITTNSDGKVLSWNDISGNNHHATSDLGTVEYPSSSTSFSGINGVDMGTSRNCLLLMNQADAASIFDFTGDAASNTGFSVLIAFQIDNFQGNRGDIVGNTSATSNSGFGMKHLSDGQYQFYLGGQSLSVPGAKTTQDHSIVMACNYNASTGDFTFWDSQNALTHTINVPKANFNYFKFRIGSTSNGSNYLDGMVGEVKVFNQVLSDEEFFYECSKMRDNWLKFMLPVEVLGEEGVIEPRTLTLTEEEANATKKIWMQINNLSYENKASVKVNEGEWYNLNHESVDIPIQEENRGGMAHGGYNTIRLSYNSDDFIEGENTVYFRFNDSDGISNGFRVVRFNLLDEYDENILPDTFFYEEDPDLWIGPYTDNTSINEGEDLWRNGDLWSNYLADGDNGFWYNHEIVSNVNIQAKCSDCHTQDGRDLELFSYSNKSIIERAKFHQLTEDEGRKIASYIRSLKDTHDNVNRHGRPWNPPYQPGPELEGKSIDYWAAGAGLDAVLEKDEDLLPYLFPGGVNEESVANLFNQDGGEDRTIIPMPLQFPDWKHWLPMIHPKDAFTKDGIYEETYNDRVSWTNPENSKLNPEKGIEIIREELESLPKKSDGVTVDMVQVAADPTMLAEFREAHEEFRYNFRWFLAQGSSDKQHWRARSGRGLEALADDVPLEFANTSLARLMAVKNFEIMQEFNLQDQALDYIPDHEQDHPTNRQWFHGLSMHVFEVPPHFTGCQDDNCLSFDGQSDALGTFESSLWYQLQTILAGGEGYQWWNGPVDYNYQPAYILKSSRYSGLYQPLRYYHSLSTMYKTKTWSGDLTTNDGMGFRIRVQGPWYFFGKEGEGLATKLHGFEPGYWPSLLDKIQPGMTKLVLEAQCREFIKAVRKHEIDDWTRWSSGLSASNFLDPVSKSSVIDVTTSSVSDQNTDGDDFEPLWADHMYWVIEQAINFGLDCEVINELITWSDEAWPNIDWSFDITPKVNLKFNDNANLYRDLEYIEAIISSPGENPTYEWTINGVVSDVTENKLSTGVLEPGDEVICQVNLDDSCYDTNVAIDTIGIPTDLKFLMKLNDGTWQDTEAIVACMDDNISVKLGLDIDPMVWLDAYELASSEEYEDNDKVTTWADVSGNGYDAITSNEDYAPTFTSDGFNGMPALVFGESNSSALRLLEQDKTNILDDDFTLFIVHQLDPVTAQTNTIVNKNGLSEDGMFFRVSTTGKVSISCDDQNGSGSAHGIPLTAVNMIRRDDQLVETFHNGDLDFELTLPEDAVLTNDNDLTLGQFGYNSQTRHHKGMIAEVIIFDRKISDEEQIIIEGYLAHKWGMKDILSSTSPFLYDSPLAFDIQYPNGETNTLNSKKISFDFQITKDEDYGDMIFTPDFGRLNPITIELISPDLFEDKFSTVNYSINSDHNQEGNDIEVTEKQELKLMPKEGLSNDYYWVEPNGSQMLMNTDPVWTTELVSDKNGTWQLVILDGVCSSMPAPVQVNVSTVLATGSDLPVELVSFTAKTTSNTVELNWTTASELNNDYFEVQSSTGGRQWKTLGKKKGQGNSLVTNSYLFIDEAPSLNMASFYRLLQYDLDGLYSIISPIQVFVNNINASVKVYPNPVRDQVNIISSGAIYSIQICDQLGRKQIESFGVGENSMTLNLSELKKGIYFLYVKHGNGDFIQRKLIKN